MTSVTAAPSAAEAFVRYVERVCRDNGRRAALRRGVGRTPEQASTMHATVAPFLPNDCRREEEHAYYTVAALLAAYGRTAVAQTDGAADETQPARRQNLGSTVALAVCRPGPGRRPMGRDTAEKRLHLLTRQNYPGIHRQLAGIVRYLSLVDVPIDWAQLLIDLRKWHVRRDLIAKNWLQAFYRTLDENSEEKKP
jgi:CRISPR system Cascade subunit CasB